MMIGGKPIVLNWERLRRLSLIHISVPEGVDIQQVKSDLEQLEHVASINQLNLWTMDGLEKNAIVHVCLEHVNHMEICKESIRDLLKDCGFQNVTIEVDEDLATHRAHKRKIEELEVNQSQDVYKRQVPGDRSDY